MRRKAILLCAFAAAMLAAVPAYSQERGSIAEVAPLLTESPRDSIVFDGSDESQASRVRHKFALDERPSTSEEVSVWGWRGRASWVMATPQPGQYVVR